MLPKIFAGAFGVFLGVSLLKFPNPPIMAELIKAPAEAWEWLLGAWPVQMGYWLLGAVVVLGAFAGHWPKDTPKWLLALPLVWLGWQFVSATHTVDSELTWQTLKHFVACAVCFYLGAFCLSRNRRATVFWVFILCAFAIVIAVGFDQHFGGLEETRRYFYAYEYEKWPATSPEQLEEYLKRISSDRIFSTLFYPNVLAGALLLWLPGSLAAIWGMSNRFTTAARSFLAVLLAASAAACLLWSGSKGGWLLALFSVMVVCLHLRWSKRAKGVFLGVVLMLGLVGFFVKYAGFFERGATSVVARRDYWRAAVETTLAKPLFGTGPGTFARAYGAIKKPESEMARLTHNDYLQQASDSGVVGCLAYLATWLGVFFCGYTKPAATDGQLRFAVWLGLLAWAMQGSLEFGLYIPALAWAAFGLAGWLVAVNAKPIDNCGAPRLVCRAR